MVLGALFVFLAYFVFTKVFRTSSRPSVFTDRPMQAENSPRRFPPIRELAWTLAAPTAVMAVFVVLSHPNWNWPQGAAAVPLLPTLEQPAVHEIKPQSSVDKAVGISPQRFGGGATELGFGPGERTSHSPTRITTATDPQRRCPADRPAESALEHRRRSHQ